MFCGLTVFNIMNWLRRFFFIIMPRSLYHLYSLKTKSSQIQNVIMTLCAFGFEAIRSEKKDTGLDEKKIQRKLTCTH